jgi:alpha-L-fucosidase
MQFNAGNVTDGNKDTYWTTDDTVSTGTLVIDLPGVPTVKYVVLQEYIRLGQRIKAFSIDARIGDKWQKISEGTTIGYKRILQFPPVETPKIRINITTSRACPVISNVEVY